MNDQIKATTNQGTNQNNEPQDDRETTPIMPLADLINALTEATGLEKRFWDPPERNAAELERIRILKSRATEFRDSIHNGLSDIGNLITCAGHNEDWGMEIKNIAQLGFLVHNLADAVSALDGLIFCCETALGERKTESELHREREARERKGGAQ